MYTRPIHNSKLTSLFSSLLPSQSRSVKLPLVMKNFLLDEILYSLWLLADFYVITINYVAIFCTYLLQC